MRIYKTINKVPGGLMVVPLFIGMVINTFFPHLLKIGGFTEALSNVGYPTILGMYLFTVGTKMTVRTAPRMLKRGFGIMFAKVGIATLIAVSVGKFFGGDLFGFSTLALLVAMSDTNGGMFMALTSVMGDKEDSGTYVPQSIETGPFLTMVILVGAGLANIPWLTMVSVIAPIAAGAVLGNLNMKSSEVGAVLTLVDIRSTVRLAAAEGYSKNTSFGFGGAGFGNSGALAGSAYTNTDEGKLASAAFFDAYNKLVVAVRQYKAQTVEGGLGEGGALGVQGGTTNASKKVGR